jgi:hypothetical protein
MFKKKEGVPEGLYMWDSSAALKALVRELVFVICLNGPRMFAYSIFFGWKHTTQTTVVWLLLDIWNGSDESKMRLNAGCLIIDCCVLACKNKDFHVSQFDLRLGNYGFILHLIHVFGWWDGTGNGASPDSRLFVSRLAGWEWDGSMEPSRRDIRCRCRLNLSLQIHLSSPSSPSPTYRTWVEGELRPCPTLLLHVLLLQVYPPDAFVQLDSVVCLQVVRITCRGCGSPVYKR